MRIRSVRNIQKITRAMQMVAASRLKRAQDVAMAAGPYSEKLAYIMRELSSVRDEVKHPLLAVRPVQKRLIVGIAADKGLCGAYNTNVLRRLREAIAAGPMPDVIAVGKKTRDHLRFRGMEPIGYEAMPPRGVDLELVRRLTRRVIADYSAATYDQVQLVYTQFRSAVSTVPTCIQLLPLEPPAPPPAAAPTGGGNAQFIFEPSAERLLPMLLEKYISNQLYRALVDAYASEVGARMVAMKSATDNAEDLATSLTRSFNRARQAAITKEILEIVSGADALEQAS